MGRIYISYARFLALPSSISRPVEALHILISFHASSRKYASHPQISPRRLSPCHFGHGRPADRRSLIQTVPRARASKWAHPMARNPVRSSPDRRLEIPSSPGPSSRPRRTRCTPRKFTLSHPKEKPHGLMRAMLLVRPCVPPHRPGPLLQGNIRRLPLP